MPELVYGCNNMMDIVATAFGKALPGGIVLLSTACARVGMFRNWDLFKNEVRGMIG